MTAEEYMLWWSSYQAAPWGEVRADLGFGIVAATVANVNRDSSTPAFTASDFMPFQAKPEAAPEAVSPAEYVERLKRGER